MLIVLITLKGQLRTDNILFAGFLTDDLTGQPNMTGGMAKYLEAKHWRIDIIVTPYSQV